MYKSRTGRFAQTGLVILLLALVLSAAPAAFAQEEEGTATTPLVECVPPLTPRLTIDQQGSAVVGLNVRSLPQGDRIGLIPRGGRVNIVDGPRGVVDAEGDCLAWWYVYDYNLDLLGWIAEGWEEYWIAPLAIPAAPKAAGIADGSDSGGSAVDVSGPILREDFGDIVEWAVFQPARGYVVLGWTWTTDEGALGCSVPDTGGPLLVDEFCALARDLIEE